MNFNTKEELFERVLPALKIKIEELKEKNIILTEKELFLKIEEEKWKKSSNLTLSDIVNDILKY